MQPGEYSHGNEPPSKKQRLDITAANATATLSSHERQVPANSEGALGELRHGRQHQSGRATSLAGAQTLSEQGIDFDYDSCIEEQMDEAWQPKEMHVGSAGRDQPHDHRAADSRATIGAGHHLPTNCQPAHASAVQSEEQDSPETETVDLNSGRPPDDAPQQRAAPHDEAGSVSRGRMADSDNTPAASCQAEAARDGEQAEGPGADDAGMARARRLAAAARAACDVLRGPVR